MKIFCGCLLVFFYCQVFAQSMITKLDSISKYDGYYLTKNYQNPYGAINYVEFNIPIKSNVTILIQEYNDKQNENVLDTVKIIYNGRLDKGFYRSTWDMKDNNDNFVENGFYNISVEATTGDQNYYNMIFIGRTRVIVMR